MENTIVRFVRVGEGPGGQRFEERREIEKKQHLHFDSNHKPCARR